MEIAITISSFDSTSTSSIKGFGCSRYWSISAWLEFESPFIDFEGLATLDLKDLDAQLWVHLC
jgi:hypothetical protein